MPFILFATGVEAQTKWKGGETCASRRQKAKRLRYVPNLFYLERIPKISLFWEAQYAERNDKEIPGDPALGGPNTISVRDIKEKVVK